MDQQRAASATSWGAVEQRGNEVFMSFPREQCFPEQKLGGLMEKVSAILSLWTWVLPQLSYRGRALAVNNLTASMLWHQFPVVEPPDTLFRK